VCSAPARACMAIQQAPSAQMAQGLQSYDACCAHIPSSATTGAPTAHGVIRVAHPPVLCAQSPAPLPCSPRSL
jgi:hypothetical protein